MWGEGGRAGRAGGSGGWRRTTGPTSPVRPRGPGGPMGPGSPLRPSLPAAPAEPGGPYGRGEGVSTDGTPLCDPTMLSPNGCLSGTYAWTGGTGSTGGTLFTRSALCTAGHEREPCEHLRVRGSRRHPHTRRHLREDRVGPGDRRSLCGPSCLCLPVHRSRLCRREDLGDPAEDMS